MAKRILIADDDAAIRGILHRALEHPMFVITEAESAPDAMAHFESEGADLAIVDLIMPGGSGAELMMSLLQAPSPPKVIVISGLAELYKSRNQVPPEVLVLTKPFAMKDLRQHVFDKLDILDTRS